LNNRRKRLEDIPLFYTYGFFVRYKEAISIKHQTPNTKHQTPNTKHQTPNTKHQTPNTKHQTPNTKHQTPPVIIWIN